ncbi:hypothetical protein GUJ93_ZPchr0009g175 [Zizania palustris]|uniref:Calcineurin-like phosphoesterase domain-containing protein n=1 Tax=Zizania palustris TaxID=103762 RepID=A0A8J5S4L8_ZIZPA|nr:hypothetical protein GUJ93_ZPchr0009g175 [Zizania palustris]
MRVSWITDDDASATVEYGRTSDPRDAVIIGPLEPSATYYYRCSNDTSREFSFRTPPVSLPVKFVVVGDDLGQTGWTKSTLQHIAAADYDMLLLPGDLSYADFYQPRWDSYGRLVEPLASARPWIVTKGNHEVEKIVPLLHPQPFKAYNARWRMPYDAGASPYVGVEPLLLLRRGWRRCARHHARLVHRLRRGDGAAPVAAGCSATSPRSIAARQRSWWRWCTRRGTTATGRTSGRAPPCMEALLYGARVDAVFSGHVHAYERFSCLYGGREDPCARAGARDHRRRRQQGGVGGEVHRPEAGDVGVQGGVQKDIVLNALFYLKSNMVNRERESLS